MISDQAVGKTAEPRGGKMRALALARAESEPLDWRLFAFAYAVIALVLVIKALVASRTGPLFVDTDDAMRLVDVHDLLSGQGWYDHIQHRLNVPYGGPIHWSRLVDAPEAALLAVLRSLAGPFADALLGYIWPLLLLGSLLFLSARLTLKLVGGEGLIAALLLPAFSPMLIAEFSPGRLDHHSVQILLVLAATLAAVEAVSRPRFGVLAGIAAMTGLAIGAEFLPAAVALIFAMTLLWVFVPDRADAMRGFGLGFAGAGIVHLAIALPPGLWFVTACDALSIVYVAAGLGVGVGLTLLSLLPFEEKGPAARMLAAAIAGGAVLAALALAFPICLAGPYAALDPWLVTHWLVNVQESESLWQALQTGPARTIGAALPLLLALVAVAIRIARPGRARFEWLVLGAILLLCTLVSVIQIRGARLALAPALPAAAWVIAEARGRYLAGRRPRDVAGLVLGWLGFSGLAIALAVMLVATRFSGAEAGQQAGDPTACLAPGAFRQLAAMPPARVMAPIDLGSHILLHTPDSVVGAPYHRAQEGILDTYRFFDAPIAVARGVLARRGVTRVVICPSMEEVKGLAERAPDSFSALYERGRLPDWLEKISPAGATLEIYELRN